MTEPNRLKKSGRKTKAAETENPVVETPLDAQQQLSQRLQTLYGSVVEEPVPDDMLRLFHQH